jgi:hypothetical protein
MVDAASGGQIGAAAVAFEGQARLQQPGQRGLVGRVAGVLPQHRCIAAKAQVFQHLQLRAGRAGDFPQPVQVLHTDQPLAAGVAGQQPAPQRDQQRARVQDPGGGGRETAAVAGR